MDPEIVRRFGSGATMAGVNVWTDVVAVDEALAAAVEEARAAAVDLASADVGVVEAGGPQAQVGQVTSACAPRTNLQ